MTAGISTACFYPQYTEQALQALLECPPQCVEIFLNSSYELTADWLKDIRHMTDAAGTKVVSLHPYTSGMEPMYFFSGYDRRFQEGLDVYRRYFEAANILGAEIVVFHGAMRTHKMEYAEYFHRFHRVWEAARQQGVELCQENVQRCISYTAPFFREMRRQLPDAGFVLDTKQVVRSGEDVYGFAQAMSGNIRHIHLSDYSQLHTCMVPGRGILNIHKLLTITRKNGFDGAVVVELYRENFDSIVDIYEGYQQILTAFSTVLHNA